MPCVNHALLPCSCIINFIILNARMKNLPGVQVKLSSVSYRVRYGMMWVRAWIHDLATSADTVSRQTLSTTCQMRSRDGSVLVPLCRCALWRWDIEGKRYRSNTFVYVPVIVLGSWWLVVITVQLQ